MSEFESEPSFWFTEGYSVSAHGTDPLGAPEALDLAELVEYVRGLHAGLVDIRDDDTSESNS